MVATKPFQAFARHFLLRRLHGHRFGARHDGKWSAEQTKYNGSTRLPPLDGVVSL